MLIIFASDTKTGGIDNTAEDKIKIQNDLGRLEHLCRNQQDETQQR